jgi:CheY-like chemotaxis protein
VPEDATLQFQLRRGLPPVEVDPEQIKSVLQNLVKNAGEALVEGRGVITVRSSQVRAERSYFEGAVVDDGLPAGTYLFFEVSDSGQGVEESSRNRMFDPFFSTKGTGRGLGLASSLGIVRAHRGTIKVYSEPGRGSTFEVILPAAQEQLMVAQEGSAKDWRGGGTILVVDDEELVREVAQDILEQQGFEVLVAVDGLEAVTVFEQKASIIRAVLLDLTMPGMDGEEAFHAIRGIDSSAVILLMSGYSQQRARQRLEGEGLAGFLHKPFRPRDLLRKIREVLVAAEKVEESDPTVGSGS